METQGHRRKDVGEESGLPPEPQPGDYWYWREIWWCMTPSRFIGNLSAHQVAEHEDGTITVTPSILVTDRMAGKPERQWHGFLTQGIWRE
jgi:hypothetical protein